jgi:hypothetical protein
MSIKGKSKVLKELRQEIDGIPIIDTHEHILPRQETLQREVDLFDLFDRTYVKADFVSAGMPAKAWDREEYDPQEGWKRIRPFLDKVRNTAYYRSMMTAFRGLYDFADEELDDGNWEGLSDRISASNKREDWYRFVLKEKANIEVSLLHKPGYDILQAEREFFLPVFWVDPFLYGYAKLFLFKRPVSRIVFRYGKEALQEEYGIEVNSFDEYLSLLDTALRKAVVGGAVAAKSVAAYRRILRYDAASKAEAEQVFVKPDNEVTPSDIKKFQDYMMHMIVQKTIEHDLPLQIHTGIQAGYGNVVANSNPLHLNNLLLAYPEAKFVLFHGGYPYTGEMAVLAKTFSNVYLDFNWVPLVSPAVAKRALAEWIETVPGNKLTWGGDCQHVEACYGHVLYAKEVVAGVLAEKVESGYFGEKVASDLARKIFRDNARELYRLDEKRQKQASNWEGDSR